MGRRTLVAALLAACLASVANAQDFPTRPITLVAPFPPGGPSDTTARLVAIHMSKALGQPVVVENVTGAGGTIGSNRVAKASPTATRSSYRAPAPTQRSNTCTRSRPISPAIGSISASSTCRRSCWSPSATCPPTRLQEFIAYLRANEKKVTEADAGVGSISNLACSVFHSLANVNPTVVSYRGTPQATQDVVAGTVDFGCNQIVNIVQHVQTGALKAYAVTSDKRSSMLPNVPTTAEAGLPAFKLSVWFGLSAPKGTPKAIIEKLNKALGTALEDEATVKRFADLGYDVVPKDQRSAAYLDTYFKEEVVLWTKVLGGLVQVSHPSRSHRSNEWNGNGLEANARARDRRGHAAGRRS